MEGVNHSVQGPGCNGGMKTKRVASVVSRFKQRFLFQKLAINEDSGQPFYC
jgi:hypothetical protein